MKITNFCILLFLVISTPSVSFASGYLDFAFETEATVEYWPSQYLSDSFSHEATSGSLSFSFFASGESYDLSITLPVLYEQTRVTLDHRSHKYSSVSQYNYRRVFFGDVTLSSSHHLPQFLCDWFTTAISFGLTLPTTSSSS